MRLVEGRPLDDVLRELAELRHRGDPRLADPELARRVARLGRDLARALGAIHQRGLIHRDVKPENVVLEGVGEDPFVALEAKPVLVDFGLLRPVEGSELTTRTRLLTPAYASPEAQTGEELDARADVFSLGATLHDLLALTAAGERSLASAGLPEIRTHNRSVDLRLAAIVRMATEKRLAVRYADGDALADDLDAYLEGRPIRALPAGRLGRLRLWARREPLKAAWIAGAVGLAVPFVVAATWASGQIASVYSLASQASRLEREGDLRKAVESYDVLANRALAGWLPGLESPLARAKRFAQGSIRSVLDMLDRDLRTAHERLRTLILTPGSDDWDVEALAFLAHELEQGSSDDRALAAESAAAFFVLHPLASTWKDPAGPLFLNAECAPPVPREEFTRLAAALRAASRPTDPVTGATNPPAVRRMAIAALSGMPDEETLLGLIDLVPGSGPGRFEDQRLALEAVRRMWWQRRYEPGGARLAVFTDKLLARWVEAADGARKALVAGDPEAESSHRGLVEAIEASYYLAAFTRVLERRPEASAPWSRVGPKDLGEYLEALAERFEACCHAGADPASFPILPQRAGRDAICYFSRDCESRDRSSFEARWDPGKNRYLYDNLWEAPAEKEPTRIWKASGENRPSQREPERSGHPDEIIRGWVSFEDQDGKAWPKCGGEVVCVTTVAAEPGEEAGHSFLEFDHVGTSSLTIQVNAPRPPVLERDGVRYPSLAIRILSRRAARFFLPNRGEARVRVSLSTGEFLGEYAVPCDPTWIRIPIDSQRLWGKKTFDAVLSFTGGTTTLRIARVVFERARSIKPHEPQR